MTKPDDEGTMGDGFKPAPVPDNEAERLREVSALGLTGVNRKDPHLNDIIQITCAVADTPIAMVNILDRPDQHTLRSCGMPEAVPTEMPIEGGLCQFVLAQGDVLIIEDLRTDERTREHPFINPPMSLRFYAGAPLVSASGYIVGTLCVMAPEPKTLDPHAVDAMRRLADLVVRLLLQGGPPRDGGDAVAPANEKPPNSSAVLFVIVAFRVLVLFALALMPAKPFIPLILLAINKGLTMNYLARLSCGVYPHFQGIQQAAKACLRAMSA